MFTQHAANTLSAVMGWIVSFINITPPGLTITLWQLATGLFLFRLVFKLALGLLNVHTSGVSYRGSSYHKDEKMKYDPEDTDWNSDW